MHTLQLGYEAPMLVDIEDLAADAGHCGICITGGGAIAGTEVGFELETPFEGSIDKAVGTLADTYYSAWPATTTAPPPFPVTT